MNYLTTSIEGPTERAPTGFEDKLVWLTKFGEPTLYRMKKGWYSGIEMFVSSKGATFKITSEYDCPSPSAAVDQLIGRIKECLETLAKP